MITSGDDPMLSVLHYLLQHMDSFIGWAVTLVAALITLVAAFISADLLHKRPQRHQERKLRKEKKTQRKAERELQQYVQEVLPASDIFQIHMLRMPHPHALENLYVPLRVQPGNALRTLLDSRLRQVEEMRDPEVYLQTELDLLEDYVSGAIDPMDALRTYKHMVIVGDPGSGKTTLLRYLALQSVRRQLAGLPSLPLYIELSAFDPEKYTDLIDLIIASLKPFIPRADTRAMTDLLDAKMNKGQVLLLLDGLDETRIGISQREAEHAHGVIVKDIKRLAAIYPSMPIVVAARKESYQQTPKLEGFDEMEIAGFRPEDSQTFMRNWFQAAQTTRIEEKIRDLQTRLEKNLRLRSLISNPLLLSLATIVYEEHLDLPESRAEFYRQCVEVLQSKWDATRDIKRQNELPAIAQLRLLQEVAWHFHNQGKRLFPLGELLQIVSQFLPTIDVPVSQARKVLSQIAQESGLLREQALGYYGFSHLTFQEYFAAQYLVLYDSENNLLKLLDLPWWEEVILLSVNMHDVSHLLQILLEGFTATSLSDDLFCSHLLLAGRCLAEKPQIRDISLRAEIVNRLFHLLRSTPYAILREQSATTLAMIGGQRVNGQLLDLLEASDPQIMTIRECIGTALGAAGEWHMAHELVALLAHQDIGRSIRMVIVRALGQMGNPGVIDGILSILNDPQEDVYVRQRIVLALAEFGGSKEVVPLLQLLDNKETDLLVQQSIIIFLGILGGQEVVARLLQILQDWTLAWQIRAAAAKALGMLGYAEAVPNMLLILKENADDIYVRKRIATAIGVLPQDAESVQDLLHLLGDEILAAEVRCSIATALAATRDHEQIEEFLLLLRDKQMDSSVRSSIVLALGYLGDDSPTVIAALKEFYSGSQFEYHLRCSVVVALGMLNRREIISELLLALNDSRLDQDMLMHIMHALHHLTLHQSIDKQGLSFQLAGLMIACKVDRYKCSNIINLLADLGDISISHFLFALLEDTNVDIFIHQRVIECIARLADDEQSFAKLETFIDRTTIADDVFRAMWTVNRRMKNKSS
jgi:HEAT repeat protein/GTPase SAR1 family protein